MRSKLASCRLSISSWVRDKVGNAERCIKFGPSVLPVNQDRRDGTSSMAKSSGITYAISNLRHRQSHQNSFVQLSSLSNVIASLSTKQILKLIRTKIFLISTIDDSILLYSVMIILRSILRNKTISVFIRPESCFLSNELLYSINYCLFSNVKLSHRSTKIAITP